jgi:L-threonylcarbamoyladenylate synthase
MLRGIKQAAQALRGGDLVAFPTETVYGLGADATNTSAVEKIFKAKGRPNTNPLIVHVATIDIAKRYALTWPQEAQRLAERFWPGPLTVVLPKSPTILDQVTAGLDTVGLRIPSHPLALSLLHEFAGPVAAPSANRSNRVSPTTADHVRAELGDAVKIILDGGLCEVGIESTVVDLAHETPGILRPGMITQQQIEQVIGQVDLSNTVAAPGESATSPGQQPIHYAPHAPAYRFTAQYLSAILSRVDRHAAVLLLSSDAAIKSLIDVHIVQMPASPAQYARRFYSTLRKLDQQHVKQIWIELPPDLPQWSGIRDRVMRATRAS